MQKRQFRIGELAETLGVERFVVRFWEKEFGLKPTRSDGGQRFYEEKDLETLQMIKELLYERGFTIAGAKKHLKDKPTAQRSIIASKKTTFEQTAQQFSDQHIAQLIELKAQLEKLQELL
jgi:DNA-binding transcriptional MerR regulator